VADAVASGVVGVDSEGSGVVGVEAEASGVSAVPVLAGSELTPRSMPTYLQVSMKSTCANHVSLMIYFGGSRGQPKTYCQRTV